MDDNMFDGMDLESDKMNLPELKPNQVWAAKLVITCVKFPSPQKAELFYKVLTFIFSKMAHDLGLEMIDSTTQIGIAQKMDGSNPFGGSIDGLDFSKFKN